MPSDAKKKCVRCGYTKAWHGRVDGAPDHEFEMPSDKDIVVEARLLLASATQGPWRAVALLTDGENHHVLAGKFSDQHIKATSDDHNGLVAFADLPANTELIARSPELLRALADEVEALRRGEFICKRCHHRKDSEFEAGEF